MGFADDIVAVNSFVAADKQMVIVSKQLRNDSLVIDQLMNNFRFYIFVLSQYAQAIIEDYSMKASRWIILALLATVAYLALKLNNQKETP